MQSLPTNAMGVYVLHCIPNGRQYIGACSNFILRAAGHIGALNRGRHVNRLLQSDWDLHGAACFTIQLVKTFEERQDCLAYEKEMILAEMDKSIKPYNIQSTKRPAPRPAPIDRSPPFPPRPDNFVITEDELAQLLSPTEAANMKGWKLNAFKYRAAKPDAPRPIPVGGGEIRYIEAEIRGWSPPLQSEGRRLT